MTDKDDRLVERLQGLHVDPSALAGDPFARRASWRATLLASGRGWVAAAIAIGVLVLGWRFSVPVSQQVAPPAAPAGGPGRASIEAPGGTPVGTAVGAPAGSVAQLIAADPPVLKQQLVDDLRAVGVNAIGYDRLGLSGVDAQLPHPVPDGVRETLKKHGIPAPADGVVRVEIRSAAGAPARKAE